MNHSRIPTLVSLACLFLPACHTREAGHEHHEHHRIVATSPLTKDVIITQQYVCQIRSQRHIEVCAMESGFLDAISVKEGQAVKQGDLLFKILPTLYQAKLDAELAEADLAQLEFNNTERLVKQNVVSQNELALQQARLAKAKAKVKLAEAELNFTTVRAPFDGIVDRLQQQKGSLIKEGDVLTTLSDNSTMWVYFNVPEARYLEYMAEKEKLEKLEKLKVSIGVKNAIAKDDAGTVRDEQKIELVLADGSIFPQTGKIGAIEAKFNSETGNIPFRADFENPTRLLRHGQTGNVLIHKTLHNAMVIPQRATFEILDKRFVFVIDEDHVAHQREIVVQHEMDDIFVVKNGLEANDKIILDGVRQVHEGEKVDFEFLKPTDVLASQKHKAE